MAFGNIIDAEPIDLGNGVPAYNFIGGDGQKTMLWGPEAEQLKAKLDASQLQKTAFAENPYQLNLSRVDVPQQDPGLTALATATERAEKKAAGAIELPPGNINPESKGQWGASETPRAPPGTTLVRTPDGGAVALPEPGPARPRAIPVQSSGDVIGQREQQGPQGPIPIGMNSRLVPNPMGGPPIQETWHPGTRGVSKQDWERKRAQTTMMPTGTRTTVEGAIPENPDFVAGMRDISWERRRGMREAADNAIAMAEERRRLEQANYDRDTAAVREQQRLIEQTQARVQQFEQTKERLRQDANSAKVDPNRIFSGGTGALRAIGGAIAAAMGQYAAAMTHSPNAALTIIDGAIERDIRAQEGEIVSKKEAAQNALADYMREGLSLEQAKVVLKQNMYEQAGSQRRLIDLTNAPKEIWNMEDQMQNAERERLNNAEEEYRRLSYGRATEEVSATARYPQAGSPGGWSQSTPREVASVQGGVLAMRKAFNEMNGKGGPGSNATVRNLQSALGEMEEVNKQVAAVDPKKKLPGYEQQGAFGKLGWAWDEWWSGAGAHVAGMDKEEQKDYELYMQARNSALFGLSQGRGQGVVRESEMKLSMQEIISAQDWGSLQRIRQRQTDAMRARLAAVQAGYSSDEAINMNPLVSSSVSGDAESPGSDAEPQ